MNKLISLLKATMSDGVQLFRYRGKNESTRRTVPLLLAILIGILIFSSANAMMLDLKETGQEYTVLSLYTLVTTIIIITEGVYKSGDLLFKPKDNDSLLAMPINRATIVAARIIKFYAFEMLYCMIFLLPTIIAYAVNVGVTPTFLLTAVTALLLLPAVPIAISCVVGLLIFMVSGKFRHKSFIQVALSFISLALTMLIIYVANTSSSFTGSTIADFSDRVSDFYYPVAAFAGLVTDFNFLHFIVFVVVNFAVLVATILLISKFYFRITTNINVVERSHNMSVEYNFPKRSQTTAMIRKELAKYFNTPVLLTNTALGLVLFMVAIGAICFKFDDIATSMMSSAEDFPLTIDDLRSYLPIATFVLVAFASLMTYIAATMISLEGRAFDLLKTMPISGRKVLWSKVLAATLLIVPITALGSIVMAVRFQFGFLDTILLLISVIAMPLVTELAGILIDLKYARFDAESDTVTVKQSASVLVATFLGLGMFLVTISLTLALVFIAGQTISLAIMTGIFVVVTLFLLMVIGTRGEEKYTALSV